MVYKHLILTILFYHNWILKTIKSIIDKIVKETPNQIKASFPGIDRGAPLNHSLNGSMVPQFRHNVLSDYMFNPMNSHAVLGNVFKV